MPSPSFLETEIKLKVPEALAFAPPLEALGFVREITMQQEISVLWDRGGELLAQDCALRVRRYAGRAWLTWKGPRKVDPIMKIRPERETAIDDPVALDAILAALGFSPVLVMEKRREVWRSRDLVICLDEAPFGQYIELEGDPTVITDFMAKLGLTPALAESRSYATLFQAARQT